MRVLSACAIVAQIGLSGCDGFGRGGSGGEAGLVSAIVNATRSACAYKPSGDTVSALMVAMGSSGLAAVTVAGVSSRICNGLAELKAEEQRQLAACGTCAAPVPEVYAETDRATGRSTRFVLREFEVDGVLITGGEVWQAPPAN